MKQLAALCLALPLIFSGCHAPKPAGSSSSVTRIEKTTDINGQTTKISIDMSDYAMRPALGNNTTTAAYVTVANRGDQPERLMGAACTCAGRVSLHTMSMKDGVMNMAEQPDGFVIAPGETLVFTPGGNHIMLEDLKTRPQEGQIETLTLFFDKAGTMSLLIPVTNTIPAVK